MQQTKYIAINNRFPRLDLILHGASKGIDSPFMKKIIAGSNKHKNNVLAFNFPYLERGDEHSSGKKLKEEQKYLSLVLEKAKEIIPYTKLRIIAKSLGALTLSYCLHENKIDRLNSVVVLGLIVGQVKLDNFKGKIVIVQGEKDRFGNAEKARQSLEGAVDLQVFEVKGADHSFRVPATKEPKYQDQAINLIFSEK